MGGLFSAPKAPRVKIPKPQKIDIPEQKPELPLSDDFGSEAARRRARLFAARRRGRASTILTGPGGTPTSLAYVNTLLGE